MKTLAIVLAALLALLHPLAALGCVLAVIAALCWLIRRAVRGYPLPSLMPWRPA